MLLFMKQPLPSQISFPMINAMLLSFFYELKEPSTKLIKFFQKITDQDFAFVYNGDIQQVFYLKSFM